MPMEFLRAMAQKSLPCTVTEESDIDRVRVLRAAGYVAAFLPGSRSDGAECRVLAITGLGRKALQDELFTVKQELQRIPNIQKCP